MLKRCLPLLLMAGSVLAQEITLEPLPYRNYGWFVGDVLDRCWHMDLEAELAPPKLPHTLNRWLTVRRVILQNGRLCVRYQVDYAPFTTETVFIPAWPLILRLPNREQPLTLPAWKLTLAPLRPIQSLKGESFMQDERLPPASPATTTRQLQLGGVLALAGLTGLLSYLFLGRRQIAWPFCRAWAELARLPEDEGGCLQAYLCLHRAFERYWNGCWWGRLNEFLIRFRQFQPLQAELETFVANSRHLFFESEMAAEPWPLARLRRLARRLALEEIRHGGLVR